jgi:hypothetical protein
MADEKGRAVHGGDQEARRQGGAPGDPANPRGARIGPHPGERGAATVRPEERPDRGAGKKDDRD